MAAKCKMCGAPMESDTCSYCGYVEKITLHETTNVHNIPSQATRSQIVQPQVVINNQTFNNYGFVHGVSRKSKMVALILCIFLGFFGVHKFYVGKVGAGIIYLFTMGLFGFGWIIDIILIAKGSFKDKFDLPLQ